MGIFDSVYINCPKCGREIEFQSKAGECMLNNYGLSDAPPAVLGDLAGDKGTCPGCGAVIVIKVSIMAVPYIFREKS